MKLVQDLFAKYWSAESSYCDDWTKANPARGQCAISAIAMQEIFGGEIRKLKLDDGVSHYFNLIDGNVYDITASQFDKALDYEDYKEVKRTKILSEQNTNTRYICFSKPLFSHLRKTLPSEEIAHISIRVPSYVAGSDKKPEVKVFCQTNKSRKPLNSKLLAPNQVVYMKWTGGPIVAKSKLVSWHEGVFQNGNVNKLRELTTGTNLFGLTDYWETVSQKVNGHFVVTLLSDEKWLDDLLYPAERSHGSSWIYLDTLEKKLKWLSLDHEPESEREPGRSIPKSIRFNVLKRDKFTCQYCGRKAPDVELHVDHVIPWSQVKEHKIENLKAACADCNLGKSNKLLD